MARMRYVKPEYWTDSKIVQLSPWARLLYIGSWNFAICDAGHLDDDAMALKLKVLPADPIDAAETLEEIVATGRILRKTLPDGSSYLHIVKLSVHQKVDARWSPRCPYCTAERLESPLEGSGGEADPPENTPERSPSPGASPKLSEPLRNSSQEGIGGEGIGTPSYGGGAGEGDAAEPPDVGEPASQQAAPPTKKSTRGTRLPEGWLPSPELVEAMRRELPDLDTKFEHKRFVDHWKAATGRTATKADWPATWRNWMREAHSRQQRGRPLVAVQPPGQSLWDRKAGGA